MDKINKTKLLLITFLTGLSKCAEEGVVRPDEQITSAVQVEQAGPSQMASTNLVFILASGKKGDIPHTFLGKEVSGDDLLELLGKARRTFEVHPTSEVKLVLGAEIMSPGMPIEKLSEVIQVVITPFEIISSDISPYGSFQIPDTSLPDKPTLQEVARWVKEIIEHSLKEGLLDWSRFLSSGDKLTEPFDKMEFVRVCGERENWLLLRVRLYSAEKDIGEGDDKTKLKLQKYKSGYCAYLIKDKKGTPVYAKGLPLVNFSQEGGYIKFNFDHGLIVEGYYHHYKNEPTKMPEVVCNPESGASVEVNLVDVKLCSQARGKMAIEEDISRSVEYPAELLLDGKQFKDNYSNVFRLLGKLTFRRKETIKIIIDQGEEVEVRLLEGDNKIRSTAEIIADVEKASGREIVSLSDGMRIDPTGRQIGEAIGKYPTLFQALLPSLFATSKK